MHLYSMDVVSPSSSARVPKKKAEYFLEREIEWERNIVIAKVESYYEQVCGSKGATPEA